MRLPYLLFLFIINPGPAEISHGGYQKDQIRWQAFLVQAVLVERGKVECATYPLDTLSLAHTCTMEAVY